MPNDFAPDVSLGENTRFFFDGISLSYVDGTIDCTPEEADTGTNKNGGYTTRKRKRRNFDGRFNLLYDPAENGITNSPYLNDGEDTPNVYIYPDFVNQADVYFYFPLAYVASLSMTLEGAGIVKYTIHLKNQGEFGTPWRAISA